MISLALSYRQNRSEFDFEELVKLTEDIRSKLLVRFYVAGLQHEDLHQEMCMTLPDIIDSYEVGSSFGGWCYFRWRRQLITLLRMSQNSKQRTLLEATSIHNENDDINEDPSLLFEPESREPDPRQEACRSESFLALKNSVLNDCSKLEAKVLTEYLQNKSYGEIAKTLRINEKAVDNAIVRIKNRIEKQEKYKETKWRDELY